MPDTTQVEKLDLRGTPCPINFVRAKLQLDRMQAGQMLEIWLDAGEPLEQVPGSLSQEGHEIITVQDQGSFFILQVCRGSSVAAP
ncbi:sulfurtransferase TusA family protein [Leptolyngbya sp. FACHB-261]|uniref:sulfurtransferase TusA family protein n=1 Tax=Leptolyngbya sp. FACHB-261 TaxID=2692806 RepID=UPI00168437A4|nr:sulfurtransferase TusA family protein [Leptolyngbya sp. FACHB-261]MBD2105110.1 sulfurtransferase TusA family protein [Leptolyngbya sp. FACHB-261]